MTSATTRAHHPSMHPPPAGSVEELVALIDSGVRPRYLFTDSMILVEASPRDRIWGIGMGKEHEHAEHPQHWRGLNLLGFALMEVRARIR